MQVSACFGTEVAVGMIYLLLIMVCAIDIAYAIKVLVAVQISDQVNAEMAAGTISSKQNTVLCSSYVGYATKDILPV